MESFLRTENIDYLTKIVVSCILECLIMEYLSAGERKVCNVMAIKNPSNIGKGLR